MTRGRASVPEPARIEHPLLPLRPRPGAPSRLREQLLAEQRFHLSSTEVNGERWLRMTVTAPSTSEETVEGLLAAIEELARTAA